MVCGGVVAAERSSVWEISVAIVERIPVTCSKSSRGGQARQSNQVVRSVGWEGGRDSSDIKGNYNEWDREDEKRSGLDDARMSVHRISTSRGMENEERKIGGLVRKEDSTHGV